VSALGATTSGNLLAYDFSKAERGCFFRKDAVLVPPVHLEPEVLTFLTARASGAMIR
jgi:hypothetical protein